MKYKYTSTKKIKKFFLIGNTQTLKNKEIKAHLEAIYCTLTQTKKHESLFKKNRY